MKDFKKVGETVREQLTDEELNQVAGGYSPEHWQAMSDAERILARQESEANKAAGKYCALNDPNA